MTEQQTFEKKKKEQEVKVFQAIDQRDMEQIKEEIYGKTIQELVYKFKQGNREVVGLSYAGVMHAARKKGNIRVIEIKVKESDDKKAYEAEATARDEDNKLEMKGVARVPKYFSSGVENLFAYQIAASKATRNAIRRLLPEELIKNTIDFWLKQQEQKRKDARSFM